METGTPMVSAPLVSGAGYSSVFSSSAVGKFPCSLFRRGREDQPFALEAWVLPTSVASEGVQQILSHKFQHDGLAIDGSVVSFGTSYVNTGSAICQYDIGECKSVHVIGKHSADQNELWVNGELVASVDITEDQKDDTYIDTDEYLYTGHTSSSQHIAVNGVAFYSSLSGDDIQKNYQAGIDFIGQDSVASQLGGVSLDLSSTSGSVFTEELWANREDFETGLKSDVEYTDEAIVPAYADGMSIPGFWATSVPLDIEDDTSIYGVSVSWSGVGVDVDVSLDGITWTPAVSGELVDVIPPGMDPAGKDLQIRVSFSGGLESDPARLERLSAIGFRDSDIENITAREIYVTHPAVVRADYEPNLYRDDNGINLHGGTLTIGPDETLDPDVARTLELWIKPLSDSVSVSVAGTVYRNGVEDSTLPVGQWSLLHYVSGVDIEDDIVITGDCILGQAALYPDSLTPEQVDFMWKSYIGATALRFNETTTIAASDDSNSVSTYEYDWAIDSAG